MPTAEHYDVSRLTGDGEELYSEDAACDNLAIYIVLQKLSKELWCNIINATNKNPVDSPLALYAMMSGPAKTIQGFMPQPHPTSHSVP